MNDIIKTFAANSPNVSLIIHDRLAKQESAWKYKESSWPIESAVTDLAEISIHHPHVVQVFDIGIDSGQPFMTMELCRGGSLGNRLRGNPIPPRQAAELAIQISQYPRLSKRRIKPLSFTGT